MNMTAEGPVAFDLLIPPSTSFGAAPFAPRALLGLPQPAELRCISATRVFGGRGREIWYFASTTLPYWQFTFKNVHERLWKLIQAQGSILSSLESGCASLKERVQRRGRTHRFPVCGVSLSVLDFILDAHPASLDICGGWGLPADHDIVAEPRGTHI